MTVIGGEGVHQPAWIVTLTGRSSRHDKSPDGDSQTWRGEMACDFSRMLSVLKCNNAGLKGLRTNEIQQKFRLRLHGIE